MKSLRRPVVYQGVTYPDYEMDFYTSNIHSKRFKDQILKPRLEDKGYLGFVFCTERRRTNARQHKILAETFPDLISESPIVSYYGLKIGRYRNELKTPMGFTFICNMICPDHIDANRQNNHHANIMLVTQFENVLKSGPRRGREYKGIDEPRCGTYRIRIQWRNILDKNGKPFKIEKRFKTEEEAASAYNTFLKEGLLTIFGLDLGLKLYDIAYKNVIETPVQEQLILR